MGLNDEDLGFIWESVKYHLSNHGVKPIKIELMCRNGKAIFTHFLAFVVLVIFIN